MIAPFSKLLFVSKSAFEDAWQFENARQLIADENVNLIEVLEQKSELQSHFHSTQE